MMKRRSVFKILAGGTTLFLSKNLGMGNEMAGTRKTFTIDRFASSFSTILDSNLNLYQFKEHDSTFAPFIRLWDKDSNEEDFSVEIACFSLDFYADAVNIAIMLASAWEGDNIDFDRDNKGISYASISYIENYQSKKFARLYVFKNLNDFVIFCVAYQDDEIYQQKYKQHVDLLVKNFVFEQSGDNASQVEIVQLDSRSTILLPFDWKYRDITQKVREDYDPKNTTTRAYYFENKLRLENSLPVIGLAHYQDNIENARYLLDVYKEAIVKDYTKDGQKTIFDNAEIVTYRDDGDKITTQSLVIKLRNYHTQYLPIEVRASLLNSSVTSGCYMVYSTNANITDPRIKEIKDLNLLSGWMTVDVMGNSMANLLARALGQGLDDYPQMFDL